MEREVPFPELFVLVDSRRVFLFLLYAFSSLLLCLFFFCACLLQPST